MTTRTRWILFVLTGLMTFAIGVSIASHERELSTTKVECYAGRLTLPRGPSSWRVLLSFEGQDLKDLNDQSALNLRNALDSLRGKVDDIPFQPRLFKRVSNTAGEPRYVFVEYDQLRTIPGASHLRFLVFDTSGALLNTQERSMHRTLMKSVYFRKLATMKQDVLMVNTMYCLGGSDETEFYTLVGNELRRDQSDN